MSSCRATNGKPIPAIVESQHAEAFAAVRSAFSALREAEAQELKARERADNAERIAGRAKDAAEKRRLDLGKALLHARKAWPERGPKAKGWGEFLEKEGIEQSTAWRYMEKAGGGDFMHEERLHETPHPAEVGPNLTLVPDVPPDDRKPLGLLADLQLYVGRWQDVLTEQEIGMVDALIFDGPYSDVTHRGAAADRFDNSDEEGLAPTYDHWSPQDVFDFVAAWAPRTRGWMVGLCDHHLIPAYQAAYEAVGRYAFAPVPCVITGMTCRMSGDGPSSWAVYAMVSRPRSMKAWGTLPGAYIGSSDHMAKSGRGKPRWLMDAIVGDYSRENDLVCDPLAGFGTTLISAVLQRRRAVGAEMDQAAVDEAFRRANALNGEL